MTCVKGGPVRGARPAQQRLLLDGPDRRRHCTPARSAQSCPGFMRPVCHAAAQIITGCMASLAGCSPVTAAQPTVPPSPLPTAPCSPHPTLCNRTTTPRGTTAPPATCTSATPRALPAHLWLRALPRRTTSWCAGWAHAQARQAGGLAGGSSLLCTSGQPSPGCTPCALRAACCAAPLSAPSAPCAAPQVLPTKPCSGTEMYAAAACGPGDAALDYAWSLLSGPEKAIKGVGMNGNHRRTQHQARHGGGGPAQRSNGRQ